MYSHFFTPATTEEEKLLTSEIKYLVNETNNSEDNIRHDLNLNEDSLLKAAIVVGCNHIVKDMISRKPPDWKPDSYQDHTYKTLLIQAVGNGNVKAAQLLIECGADIHYKTGWQISGVDSVEEALDALKRSKGEHSTVYKEMCEIISFSPFKCCTIL